MVKKLRIGDIVVQAVNEDEAQSLKDESNWGNILGEKAKAVRPTYKVIVFNIRTDEINPKKIEKSIDMIQERNKRVESQYAMEIFWLRWFKLPKLGQPTGHLIIKFISTNHANAAIDESLIIGSGLKTYQIYNRACKIQ